MRRRPRDVDVPVVDTFTFWSHLRQLGTAEDPAEGITPPRLAADRPTRAHAERTYVTFHDEIVARFRARPIGHNAFPVATFESDDNLRAEAEGVLAAERRARKFDPREVLK